LVFFMGACFPEPDYPDTPAIGFKSIRNSPAKLLDTVRVSISFQDGNGDLGLASEDTVPPFQALQANKKPNLFYNNIFVSIYKKVKGVFVPVIFQSEGFNLNGRFPLLNPKGKVKPLEGELSYEILFFYAFPEFYSPRINLKDTLVFDVQITDRALNKSNTIRTEEIVIGLPR